MFMLRLSACALSVTSVRWRAACPLARCLSGAARVLSGRGRRATGGLLQQRSFTRRSARLGVHAGSSNWLLAQHYTIPLCVWRLYAVIAGPKRFGPDVLLVCLNR